MTTVAPALRHARAVTFGLLAVNGFTLGMWVVNIPEIRDRTGTDTEQLGYLILLLGGAALLGMQVSGRLVDRFGGGKVAVVAGAMLSVAVTGPGWATSIWTLGLALVALGVANGLIDVAQNSHAVQVESGYGRPIMSAFHAWFSLGGLLASLVGGGALALGIDLRITLVVAGLAALTTCALINPYVLPPDTNHASETTTAEVSGGSWNMRVVVIAALAFALFMSEGVAYDWSTVHLHDSLDADKQVAAWAFGAFSIAMTVVRLLADRVVARIGPAAYVQRAALIGAAGLSIAALAPEAWIAIVGWSVFGIGLAGCIPQFFSAAGRIDPARAGLYMARVTSAGYVGLLAGPALIGIATRWVPLTTAFILPIAGCVLAGLLARRALEPS